MRGPRCVIVVLLVFLSCRCAADWTRTLCFYNGSDPNPSGASKSLTFQASQCTNGLPTASCVPLFRKTAQCGSQNRNDEDWRASATAPHVQWWIPSASECGNPTIEVEYLCGTPPAGVIQTSCAYNGVDPNAGQNTHLVQFTDAMCDNNLPPASDNCFGAMVNRQQSGEDQDWRSFLGSHPNGASISWWCSGCNIDPNVRVDYICATTTPLYNAQYSLHHCEYTGGPVVQGGQEHQFTAAECGGVLPAGDCIIGQRGLEHCGYDHDFQAFSPLEEGGPKAAWTTTSACGSPIVTVDYLCPVIFAPVAVYLRITGTNLVDLPQGSSARTDFVAGLKSDVVSVLAADASQISIVSLAQGNGGVVATISMSAVGAQTEPSVLADTLQSLVNNTGSSLYTSSTVANSADSTQNILVPPSVPSISASSAARADGFVVTVSETTGPYTFTLVYAGVPDFSTPALKRDGSSAIFNGVSLTQGQYSFSGLAPGAYHVQVTDANSASYTSNSDFPTGFSTLCVDGGNIELVLSDSVITTTPELTLKFSEDLHFTSVSYEFVKTGGSVCKSAGGTGTWSRSAGSNQVCNSPFMQFSLDLNTALEVCGFAREETQAGRTVYTASIEITSVEAGTVVRGVQVQKTVQQTVLLELGFDTSVSATTSATSVFGPRITEATITEQSFNSVTARATLTLLTSVQWPYQLDSASIVDPGTAAGWKTPVIVPQTPDGTTATAAACTDGTDPYDAGNACTQYWTVTIERFESCGTANPSLTLVHTGWTTNFGVICHSGFSGACSTPNPNTDQVTFDTSSENYCPDLLDSQSASAILRVHSDSSHTTENNQFVLGSTSYFEATVSSPINIENVHVEAVRIIAGGATGVSVMYSNTYTNPTDFFANGGSNVPGDGINTLHGNAASMTVTDDVPSTPREKKSHFQWVWNDQISAAQGDFSTSTVVEADLRVRFADQANPKRMQARFHPLSSQGATVPVGTRAQLSVTGQGSSSSGATSFSGTGMATIVLACVVGALLVFLVLNRRKSPTKDKKGEQTALDDQTSSVELQLPSA